MTDSAILQMLNERDEQALQIIQEKYEAYCKAIARNILFSLEDTEECVSTVFLKTWNAIPPAAPNSLQAFLGKITRNTALDVHRHNTAAKRGEGQVDIALSEIEEIVKTEDTAQQTLDNKLFADIMNQFLSAIPAQHRMIFLMRYLYFHSIGDIAKALGASEGKVKSVLFRVRKKLKIRLEMEDISL